LQVLQVFSEALHLIEPIHCVFSTPSRCPCIEGLFDNVTDVACPFSPSTNMRGKKKGVRKHCLKARTKENKILQTL